MPKMSKLDYQMHLRMEAMKCIGESRHQAKKEYKEMMGKNSSNRTMGIHSHLTYDAYKQTSIEFIRYIRCNYKEIKDVDQIKEEHVIEYLKYRQDDGKSSHTISKDMAALNKLYNFYITKKDAGIKERSYKDIKRSREPKEHDRKYNADNYRDQIIFAKATGCRRQSVLVAEVERVIWKDGSPIEVYLKEKGGKERHATILKEYQNAIKEIMRNKESEKPLFGKYTKKIDNHAFRREYAKKRYEELVKEKGFDAKDYRGYNRSVLKELSKDLGHNRIDVVIYNYLK